MPTNDFLNANSDLAAAYFDRFVMAFATFDGEQVADLIEPPFIALSDNGSRSFLHDRRAVVSYYQAALDDYHAAGCRRCQWSDLSVTSIGSHALLAAVTWELLKADGAIAVTWRQSYALNLSQHDNPKAVAAVSHASD